MNQAQLKEAFNNVLNSDGSYKVITRVGEGRYEELFSNAAEQVREVERFKSDLKAKGYSLTEEFEHGYLFKTYGILDANREQIGSITVYNGN